MAKLNKWDYQPQTMVCYSDSECASYKKSAEFLGDTVEDWGGGTGWSKKYFKNYRNIDGTPHPNVDEVADLTEYTSRVDNILMRQTLETSYEWRKMLENAINSFKKKFCLIVFTPFVDETRVGPLNPVIDRNGVDTGATTPDIYFNKQDILDYFPLDRFKIREEEVATKQGYQRDWILYVERLEK